MSADATSRPERPARRTGRALELLLLGGRSGFRPVQRPQFVLRRGHHDLGEEPLHTVLVGVAVVPNLPLDEHFRALRQPLGPEPAHRALVPDLDLVPGRVVLPLAARRSPLAARRPPSCSGWWRPAGWRPSCRLKWCEFPLRLR